MENMSSDECPSLSKFYDELVRRDELVIESTIAKMGNKQLLEFYDYVVEKSEDEDLDGCELYWYVSLMLEEVPVIKMYKNGQLYVDTTLGNDNASFILDCSMSDQEAQEIRTTVELLEQRKREKKNPIKKLLKIIRER